MSEKNCSAVSLGKCDGQSSAAETRVVRRHQGVHRAPVSGLGWFWTFRRVPEYISGSNGD